MAGRLSKTQHPQLFELPPDIRRLTRAERRAAYKILQYVLAPDGNKLSGEILQIGFEAMKKLKPRKMP